jgi:hypothetical protein
LRARSRPRLLGLLAVAAVIVAVVVLNLLKPGPPSPIPLHRAPATACTQHWVGSWAESPSGVSQTQTLANQTARMIIAPHLGGDVSPTGTELRR